VGAGAYEFAAATFSPQRRVEWLFEHAVWAGLPTKVRIAANFRQQDCSFET
jgi:hypothetical protein